MTISFEGELSGNFGRVPGVLWRKWLGRLIEGHVAGGLVICINYPLFSCVLEFLCHFVIVSTKTALLLRNTVSYFLT
jgi:hypothetical protein